MRWAERAGRQPAARAEKHGWQLSRHKSGRSLLAKQHKRGGPKPKRNPNARPKQRRSDQSSDSQRANGYVNFLSDSWGDTFAFRVEQQIRSLHCSSTGNFSLALSRGPRSGVLSNDLPTLQQASSLGLPLLPQLIEEILQQTLFIRVKLNHYGRRIGSSVLDGWSKDISGIVNDHESVMKMLVFL